LKFHIVIEVICMGRRQGRNYFSVHFFKTFQSTLSTFSRWGSRLTSCISVLNTHPCIASIFFIPFNYPGHLGGYLKDIRLKSSLCYPPKSFGISIFLQLTRICKHSMPIFPRINAFYPTPVSSSVCSCLSP
jgi:hypothetical protein